MSVRRTKRKLGFSEKDILGYIFATPAILLFVVFTLLPIVLAVVLSFSNFNGISFESFRFNGLRNYTYIFRTDSAYWEGFRNIIVYTVITVPFTLAMSMVLAVIVHKKLPMTKFFRGLFYIPGITSVIASATVWRYLLAGNGVINGMITQINQTFDLTIKPILLTNKQTALIGPILMACWGNLGGNMVLFLAAFGNISQSVVEAAEVDGASQARIFFQIKLPLIRPAIFFALTLALIGSPQMFEPILAMDANTTTPVYEIYKNAVKGTAVGLGAAQSVILFVFIMIVTFVMQKLNKEMSV